MNEPFAFSIAALKNARKKPGGQVLKPAAAYLMALIALGACANAPAFVPGQQVPDPVPADDDKNTLGASKASDDARADVPSLLPEPKEPAAVEPAKGNSGVVDAQVTKFPLVLHHGLLSSRSKNNFKDVKPTLEKLGFKVFETEVAMANGIEFRSKQLAQQIDAILESTGAEKVNLIGHSMGGLDARYLVSSLGYENKVASVTTLGSPHMGTAVADQASDGKGFDAKVNLDTILGIYAVIKTKSLAAFSQVDLGTAVKNLSTDFMQHVFNPQNPDRPEVYYQSWAGRTKMLSTSLNEDVVNPSLLYSFKIETAAQGENDGLVAVTSAKWGDFRGVLPADHFDIIGHGSMGAKSAFDHLAFFKGVAQGLARKGY